VDNGPLWVRGGVSVEAADGFEYEVRNRVTLCRCGQSNNKPFCDGSHWDVGFKDP
jgi:CDGSH-type Zn-finger protein